VPLAVARVADVEEGDAIGDRLVEEDRVRPLIRVHVTRHHRVHVVPAVNIVVVIVRIIIVSACEARFSACHIESSSVPDQRL
jgi:hypothetical protein